MRSRSVRAVLDLPMPGSPDMSTTCPSPLLACSQRRSSNSISSSRPTSGVSPALRCAASKRPSAAASREHPPRVHRLDDPLQRVLAEIEVVEGAVQQPVRAGADDHLVGTGQPLQSRREVGRLSDRHLGDGGIPRAGLADDHRPGGDADANLKRRRRADLLDRCDDLERERTARSASSSCARGQPKYTMRPSPRYCATWPSYFSTTAAARLLIRAHQLAQLLGVELLRQRRRTHQVAEHDGELAPLGVGDAGDWRAAPLGGVAEGARRSESERP